MKPGYAFVCYEGVNVDGHTFIPQAIQNGATTIVGEKLGSVPSGVTYIQTPNGRIAFSLIAANWYGNPADRLKLIGITGTNGKTSTAHLAHSIFKAAGLKSGLMGTVGTHYADVFVEPTITTLDPLNASRTVPRHCRCWRRLCHHGNLIARACTTPIGWAHL